MRRAPEPGDVVKVQWVDIYSDPTGDPEKASLLRRWEYGVFHAWRKDEASGVDVLVLRRGNDDGGASGQEGFTIFPKCCLLTITVVHRPRKRKSTVSPEPRSGKQAKRARG